MSMSIGSKNEELRELMQPAKTMMQQFLIFEKMGCQYFNVLQVDSKFQAGWHKSAYGNWWYQAPDSTGEYAVGWNEIEGEWYYFNQRGILLQNQWKKMEQSLVLFDRLWCFCKKLEENRWNLVLFQQRKNRWKLVG